MYKNNNTHNGTKFQVYNIFIFLNYFMNNIGEAMW